MKNLKKLRESKGLSQQKLAEQFNISQQSIYKYENNLAEPDITTLMELSDFFDTSVDYLIGYTDSPDIDFIVHEISVEKTDIDIMKKYLKLSEKHKLLIKEMVECLHETNKKL